jgi:hypothetical protein
MASDLLWTYTTRKQSTTKTQMQQRTDNYCLWFGIEYKTNRHEKTVKRLLGICSVLHIKFKSAIKPSLHYIPLGA